MVVALLFVFSVGMQSQNPAGQGNTNPQPTTAIPSLPGGPGGVPAARPTAATDSGGGATSSTTSTTPQKHRVAIMNFNHARVLRNVQSTFGSEQNLGQYFADLLANRLTADNLVHVVDRNGMNNAMLDPPLPVQEVRQDDNSFRAPGSLMNLGVRTDEGGRYASPQLYNKVGSILGVDPLIRYFEADAVVNGEILEFGREDEREKGLLGRLHLVGNSCPKSRAIATVNVRMIDLNKGELITSARLTALSHRAACNLLMVHGYTRPVTSINDTNFPLTPLGDALSQVAYMVAQMLETGSQQTPVYNPTQLYGRVADIAGEDVTINIGSVAGVHLGDVLVISHISRTIKDPESSKPMRSVEDSVGQINITSVTPFYAVGRFTGRGTPAVNDMARSLDQ